MKKLLAMLLTLALLLPMCGLAEETAPEATKTTITFRDFNGRALVAEMEEEAEAAYRDLLDALRVEVYRQGFGSVAWELFLNGQLMADYALQTSGADAYISSDVLGGTVYLNLDEDMRHIAEILHQWNVSQSVYTDAGVELPVEAVSESIAQKYEDVGALLARITKNPLITGEMQPEDVANGLFETDWTWAIQRMYQLVKGVRAENVTNPPEGCESATNVFYFTLSNEQLVEELCILLDTAEETPAVKAYVDLLNTYRQLAAFAQNQPVEDADLQTWLRQQTLLVEDAQVAQYAKVTTTSSQVLREVISYKAATTDTPNTLQDATLTIDIYPLQGASLLKWRQETAGKGTNGQLWMDAGRIELRVMPDDGVPTSYSCDISPLDNGTHILLQMMRSTGVEMPGLSWSATIDTQLVDGEVQQDAEVWLLWQGEHFLTIAAETRPCESRPLPSGGDVLDLGEISSARFKAYMTGVMFTAGQVLPRIMMNLPDSTRQLITSVSQLLQDDPH